MSKPKPAPLLVAAAIIHDGQRFLIAQRQADSKLEAGKWEFPGGKVEFAEHPSACLAREIKEELNLEIEVESFYDLVSHIYDVPPVKAHIVILAYLARVTGGEMRLLEVADARWIERAELANHDFAAADIPLVERLLREG